MLSSRADDLKLHAQLLLDNMAWKEVIDIIRRELDSERDRLDYNDPKRMAVSVGQTVLTRIERKLKTVAQGGALKEIS